MRWTMLALSIAATWTWAARARGPIFEPPGLHRSMLADWASETAYYDAIFAPEAICLSPTEPLCLCSLDEVASAVVAMPMHHRLAINTATMNELETLPGVGPSLAQAIASHRPFQEAVDLLEVPGIGPAKYRRISSVIRIDD